MSNTKYCTCKQILTRAHWLDWLVTFIWWSPDIMWDVSFTFCSSTKHTVPWKGPSSWPWLGRLCNAHIERNKKMKSIESRTQRTHWESVHMRIKHYLSSALTHFWQIPGYLCKIAFIHSFVREYICGFVWSVAHRQSQSAMFRCSSLWKNTRSDTIEMIQFRFPCHECVDVLERGRQIVDSFMQRNV